MSSDVGLGLWDGAQRAHMWRKVREQVKPAYFFLRRVLTRHLVERWIGIDTARVVSLRDLGLAEEGRTPYEVMPARPVMVPNA
jgi:hypothetical protein